MVSTLVAPQRRSHGVEPSAGVEPALMLGVDPDAAAVGCGPFPDREP
ncbi:hypothetical protein [Actinoplanes sichuanensis]|uniref:Uncharacterized protein n=1 Tax=Actinoplanes sichuanensis TaxID=512349 RepID=A0ABW4AL82_9ACTN|nr:hypothetical protein [Actinoplanes sichuanensis]